MTHHPELRNFGEDSMQLVLRLPRDLGEQLAARAEMVDMTVTAYVKTIVADQLRWEELVTPNGNHPA